MVNYIKKFSICILIISILLFTVEIFIGGKFIIKGFSLVYPICGIIISISLFFISVIIRKLNKKHKIFMNVLIFFSILIMLILCLITYGIKKQIKDNETIYDIYITDLSDKYEIKLYEYNAFQANSGYLCIKVNNYIYKRIPNTYYSIEPSYSLTNQDGLILNYNVNTNILSMKYKINSTSEYYENIITYFCNYQ